MQCLLGRTFLMLVCYRLCLYVIHYKVEMIALSLSSIDQYGPPKCSSKVSPLNHANFHCHIYNESAESGVLEAMADHVVEIEDRPEISEEAQLSLAAVVMGTISRSSHSLAGSCGLSRTTS